MSGRPRQPIAVTFWNHISPEPNTGCWLWDGPVGGQPPRWGYGKMKHGGITMSAHRVSWELHRGPIPAKMWICHKCDVPRCCNPDHLFLGNASTNALDAVSKGRTNTLGEKNRHAKLTAEQVIAIRADTRIAEIVGAEVGVSGSQVRYIRRRLNWRHI
jgi:hypothetical protein